MALQRIYSFDQEDGEKLPEAWARFCFLIRARPGHDLEKHDLLDIFYSGLTIESRAYLDSCADCVFRKRTPDEAEELLAKISKNHDDWSTPEPTPTPILKKRGMIELNDEDMREAKKSLMEKGIKSEDVKNLPPIEDLCKIIPPSSTIEYMKDIVSNKRKIPNEEISTMLANYSFNGKVPKKLGDPEMPEDDNMSIILGRPFLNTAGAVIDCNKGKVTFNVDDKEHTVYFPKRIDKVYGVNTIFNVKTIKVGSIDCPIYEPKEEYQTLVIGSISIQYKKRKMNNYNFGEVFEGETTSTGRPSRASTRIRRSYNEDVIAPSFDEGNGDPNASSFPCYEFLSNAGLLDDFLTLVGKAGLTAYMEDERKQYYMLTKIFVKSFKFNNKHFNPTVAFKIYGNPITMKLKDFCAALDIAPAGTAKKIEDNPRVLLELYREITNDDCRTIQRGKIRNIQLPAIKYFAYYLATSILGRENTSNISSYHLAFLIAALTGETPYHLGSVIARHLSNKGPIYGGIIASRILARLDLPLDPTDVEIPPVKLDIAAMKSHQFVTVDSSMDNIVYRMLFADGDEREVLFPQTDLFSIGRKPWSRSKEEVDDQLKIQGFHQQHDSEDAEPSYDYTVTYCCFFKHIPRTGSSYYGDTTSWGGNELHLGQKPKLGGGSSEVSGGWSLVSFHIIIQAAQVKGNNDDLRQFDCGEGLKSNFGKILGIYAKGPIFQNDGAKDKRVGPEAPHTRPRPKGGAALLCGRLGAPDALLWTIYAFRPKNARGYVDISETIQAAAIATPPRDRNSVRHSGRGMEGIFTAITTNASPSTSHVSHIHV
ncbi:hypothetical protein QYE76_051393 [Lolium multiflorum]|uniref:Arabidopsis retrotransposon Orf1 C-terminal domain-containing protein n=1 Tax=Lolium multiflorum TaxID=4521 RepID=A0AAD8WI44_LOLMU|nr:hypothetical protein QYE76_051393 [Lolium multiflorum]